MLTWASVIFSFEVLNDSCSVLLLLKTKISGGVHHDGRTETTDHCPAPGWGWVWQDSGSAPDFHQYGEVVLPAAQPGSQNKWGSLRAVRKAHCPESWTEAETVLFGFLPEQVVECTSGAGEAEGSLHLYLSGLREGIHGLRQQPSEVLLPCLLYCISVRRCPPWIRGRFKMKQPSRWRCIWQGGCWPKSSSPGRSTGTSSRR
mgnify:FL=1|jgi:hypothetical protein